MEITRAEALLRMKSMRPMLAKSYEDGRTDDWPYIYVQPKLDGQRAIWTGAKLLSRTGKEILGVPHIVKYLAKAFKDIPLDGELYKHGETLQEIIANTRCSVNLKENDIVYHIYDLPIEGTFEERYKKLKTLKGLKFPLGRVTTIRIADIKELVCFSSEAYEGSMLRNPNGFYKFGKRSADLLKVKIFQDDEFIVTGVTELMHREKVIVPVGTPGSKLYADGRAYKDGAATPGKTMGSLVCSTADGATFEVGTGFSDELREQFWKNPPVGQQATIKFQHYTKDGVPFLPVFITLRDYE